MDCEAIVFERTGGPDVLQLRAVALAPPGPGEVQVAHAAIGVNFIDVYHRSGLYPTALPATPGLEAAGAVVAVGDGVTTVRPGDRVAYVVAAPGSYATARNVPAERLVPLPAAVDELTAAAALLKGLTAWYLLHRTYPVRPGDTILVHAAAGGLGLLMCQWARALGATVIGTVGTAEKAALARAHGCNHTILYAEDDVAARVRELTGGEGVPVVYDAVGAATFAASLDALAPLGVLVSVGNASGPPPPISPLTLGQKGSLTLTRPSLFHHVARRADLLSGAAALFDALTRRAVEVRSVTTRPLSDAADVHRDLEARRTTGSTVLV